MNDKSIKSNIFLSLKYIFLSICAIVVLYPLFFLFISSVKSNDEIFLSPFNLPQSWDFSVYIDVWKNFDISKYFLNSLYYAVLSVLVSIVIGSMAAYALTRMKWRLSKLVMGLFLIGVMIPVHSELVPLYIGFNKFGMTNPKINLILIFVTFSLPTTIFILSGFIHGIPVEMEESAVIDGCSIFKLFWKIIFPLMKPAISTVTIFNFLGSWNDFVVSLIFIQNESDKTLQLGITRFQSAFATRYSYLLAAIIIAIIPSMTVYIIMQDKIISGITAGAVKG